MEFSIDKAKALLDSGIAEAQDVIRDPSKVDDILLSFEDRLKEVPVVGETLSDIPLMISMVKGYITKEYTDVSPKVIVTLIGAFLYMIRKKDLIPDSIPVIGAADDVSVLGLAMKLCRPELDKYRTFRDLKRSESASAETEEAPSAQAGGAAGPVDIPARAQA